MTEIITIEEKCSRFNLSNYRNITKMFSAGARSKWEFGLGLMD